MANRPLHVGLIYWDPFTPGGVQSQVAGRIEHLGYPDGPVRYTLFSKQPPPDPHPWPHVRTETFSGWDRLSIAVSEYTAARDLMKRLDRVHLEDPFDLLDLHAGGAGPLVARWSGHRHVPYVFVSHSIRFFAFPAHGLRWEVARYYAWSNRRAAEGARRVIAVSGALKAEWIRFGFSPESIDVLHTATSDPPQVWDGQPRKAGPLRLLFVGRTQWDKGLDVLIDALAQCRAQKVDTELTVLGQIAEDHPVRRACEAQRLAVTFAGPQANETARRLMAEFDALVIPSRYDPCPVVAIEALAAGALILATRVGGLAEQIDDGTSGILLPSDDATAMARAILDIAAAPEAYQHLRVGARKRSRAFLWSTRSAEILRHYHAVSGRTTVPSANSANGGC